MMHKGGERVGRETDPFYTSGAWLRIRDLALRRDHGYCVWCRRAGYAARDAHGRRVPVRATLVHHIIPRSERPDLELVLENLVSLCARCHDEAHPEKHAGMTGKKDAVPEIAKGIAVARL